MELGPQEYRKITVVHQDADSMKGAIELCKASQNRIAYAYKLLQEKAVEKGLTKELQALKKDFQVAMGHYENSKYHEAQSVADRIIQSLKDYK
jgi:hypothetical protein